MNKKIKFVLVSACLLGGNCKYNGTNNRNEKVIELMRTKILIPVCPEQFGGLPTPREPSERQKDGRILTKFGVDVTKNFQEGADRVLEIAKLLIIKEAILKQRSPSCGSGQIYNGTFSGTVIMGDGVTTALLKKHGIKVISEEEL